MFWNIFALVIDLSNNFGRVIYLRMLYTHCFIQYDYQGSTWIHSVSIGCVPKHIMLVLFAGLCRKVAEWPVYDAHDLIPDTTLQQRFQISHSATKHYEKRGSNNVDQHFYQYQQNEQLSITSKNLTLEWPRHMTLQIQVRVWYRHTHLVEINKLTGSKPSHLNNWISNGNSYINNQ